MTTNFRLLAMAAVAMLAMNSCVKEENLNNGDKKGTPVEFEMGVNSVSRTETPDDGYATTFVEGDEVGIFVYNGEKAVVKNAHYKLNADRKWVAQGEAITAEEGVSYSYYAYYPYNAEATDATSVSLTVAGDQTTGYTGSDALMAKSENVAAGTTTVPLQYSHAFALVQVSLKGDLAAKNATVTLQNVYPTAALNLKDGTVGEAAGTSGTVAMKACTTNGDAAPYNYRAIVPAQKIAENNGILTTLSNGKNYKFTYSVEVPYESGKLRQFDVTLGSTPTETKIEIGEGTIKDWEDGSTVSGDGSAEELPLINELPSEIPTLGTDAVIEQTSSTWFNIINKELASATISEAEVAGTTPEWENQANLTFNSTYIDEKTVTSNSWYGSIIGYYLIGGISTEEKDIYELSFKAKGTNVYTTNENPETELTSSNVPQLYLTCRNADNSTSFSIRNNTETPTATNSTITLNADNTWKTCKFYIHFYEKGSTKAPSGYSGSNVKTPTTASDYSKIQIRISTNNKATASEPNLKTSISITDVKLVPYAKSVTTTEPES